jgi:hypothetical protein
MLPFDCVDNIYAAHEGLPPLNKNPGTFVSFFSFGSFARGWGSTAPALPGATRSGSAERQSSEIPSRTRSVSAFHLSGPSMGPRSSGDVDSEFHPCAKKTLDAGLQDLNTFLGPVCSGLHSERVSVN